MKAALDMPTADARSVERDVERKLLELEAERACLFFLCVRKPTDGECLGLAARVGRYGPIGKPPRLYCHYASF